MEKHDRKTPDEVARDLEDFEFAEIAEADLKEAFGGEIVPTLPQLPGCTNTNCLC
jgi:hypothetical protein